MLKTKLPRTMRAILAATCVATSRAGGWLAADDFTSNGVTFKVQTYVPDGTSQASYPMTLCLHSSGSLGTDNAKQLGSGEPCYVWASVECFRAILAGKREETRPCHPW
jgi:predicted peptidase